MASLAEVYEGHVRDVGVRRVYFGATLFVGGAVFAVLGLLAGTTDLLAAVGYGTYETRRIAGAVGGLGVPAVFVGIFTILPASQRVRAAAVIGASVAVFGVALFWSVYPDHWAGYGRDLTLPVASVYLLGILITFWCLFVGVATFKTRNDPGGTATVEVTTEGKTRVVEVDRSEGVGSVGVVGDPPHVDPDREPHVSDGGAAAPDLDSPPDDAAIVDPDEPRPDPVDTYCGNCSRFEYARTSQGIRPRCSYHDRLMDDMDACESWEPNRQ